MAAYWPSEAVGGLLAMSYALRFGVGSGLFDRHTLPMIERVGHHRLDERLGRQRTGA